MEFKCHKSPLKVGQICNVCGLIGGGIDEAKANGTYDKKIFKPKHLWNQELADIEIARGNSKDVPADLVKKSKIKAPGKKKATSK